jgi:hypothetical protein
MTGRVDRADYEISARRPLRNAWTAASMAANGSWRVRIDSDVHEDISRLEEWSRSVGDPLEEYEHGAVSLPALQGLGLRARDEMRERSGVFHVKGIDPQLDDLALRLCYLAVGLATGSAITNYGRLYDVHDRGEDYRANAVPISMTRETTSFHTDSSARGVEPDHVGLLCLQPALRGGESLVTSCASVHEELRDDAPHHLSRLYRDFCRDVVTPGSERNLDTIASNRFPIFRHDEGRNEPVMRYMRYWIEKANDLLGLPHEPDDTAALDHLDRRLADERLVLRLNLKRGEMLWVDNQTIAHNRSAYEDEPEARRLMVRMWTKDRGASEAPVS